MLFNGNLFAELIYIVQNIWDKKYQAYRSSQNSRFLMPLFSCFTGFDNEEVYGKSVNFKAPNEVKDIKQAATSGIEQLAWELFNSKRLKYFNLNDIKGARPNNAARE